MFKRVALVSFLTVVIVLSGCLLSGPSIMVSAQAGCQTFKETGKSVCGRFLQYWQEHGGLAQQGFPISNVLGEDSEVDGKLYTVQYFERAVFEYHPEKQPPNDVLLSLLGSFRYRVKYPNGATLQNPNRSVGSVVFPQTGKRLGGAFLEYWRSHGGLSQQGYPISEEFSEKSDLDGKTYNVQYFERAIFEMHPEQPVPYRILLTQLGRLRYDALVADGHPWYPPPVAVPPAVQVKATPRPSTPVPAPTVKPPPGPPKDAEAFGQYIVDTYPIIGDYQIETYAVSGGSSQRFTHRVEIDVYSDIVREANSTEVREWANKVLAAAQRAWPGDTFQVLLLSNYLEREPCDNCVGACYQIGAQRSDGFYNVTQLWVDITFEPPLGSYIRSCPLLLP